MISEKEFTQLVREKYDKYLSANSKKERDEYFNSEEAQNYLKSRYKEISAEFEAGEIGENGIRVGATSQTANCLYMMFE